VIVEIEPSVWLETVRDSQYVDRPAELEQHVADRDNARAQR
jgi:hypothetical protein